jgi:hypothetical protein
MSPTIPAVVLALLLAAAGPVAAFSAADYDHSRDVHDDITFHWKIVGTGATAEIRFALEVNTLGWIGFGERPLVISSSSPGFPLRCPLCSWSLEGCCALPDSKPAFDI